MEAAALTNRLLAGEDLGDADMRAALDAMLAERWTHLQAAAFLVALHAKGETPTELAAGAAFLSERWVPVAAARPEELLDTAGTGGDGQATFNISTAAAFVAAACGVRVAKHGNRAQSGKSGSSELLDAIGGDLGASPERLSAMLDAIGLCFMFAPAHHPALKAMAPVRQGLGVRTVFNLLGPLINPARAGRRLAGVFAPRWLLPFAETFRARGVRRAVVVHACGMDEFSVAAPSRYVLLDEDGDISEHEITPQEAGVGTHEVAALRIDSVAGAVRMFNAAIGNEAGAPRDATAFNAGAALFAAGAAESIAAGVALAMEALAAGKVRAKVDEFIAANRAA